MAFLLLFCALFWALAAAAAPADSGVITVYHHVARGTPPSTTVSPAVFRSHLEYLRDNGFTVLPLDEMVEALRQGPGRGQPLPDKAVAITFDDGYSSIFDTAFPMLQEFGMPFAVFISTEPADSGWPGYMDWGQIRALAEAGVLIGNHTHSHAHLLELDEARLREELLGAEARIEAETGQSHRYLAYPYGEYDPAIQELLAEWGFTGFAQHSGAVGRAEADAGDGAGGGAGDGAGDGVRGGSDFLALPRYPLAGIYANLETAKIKLESLAFSVTRVDPVSPVTRLGNPALRLRFAEAGTALDRLNCFFNNKPLPINWIDRAEGVLELKPAEESSDRRWNYTCTARADDSGRFYWYSAPWVNPDIPE